MPTVQDLVTRYAEGPDQLRAALDGLPETTLDLASGKGRWTIRQIVHHLADGDDLWGFFIKAAVGGSDSLFSLQWYWERTQDEWVVAWNYASRPIEPSLELIEARRRSIVQLVEQVSGAIEKGISMQMRDGSKKIVTVGDILEIQSRHVDDHVEEIRSIRQKYRV